MFNKNKNLSITITTPKFQSFNESRKKLLFVIVYNWKHSFKKHDWTLGKIAFLSFGRYNTSIGCFNPDGGMLDRPVINFRRDDNDMDRWVHFSAKRATVHL